MSRSECLVNNSPIASAATAAAAHASGNLLVVCANFQTGSGTTSLVISDTAGNTWHAVGTPQAGGPNRIQIWYAFNCLGDPANVVTATAVGGPCPYLALSVMQFTKVPPTDPLDGHSQVSGAGLSDPVDIRTGTVTVSTDLAVIVGFAECDGASFDANNGFALTQFAGPWGSYFADVYKIVTASEPATMIGHFGPFGASWVMCAASFTLKSASATPVLAMHLNRQRR